jgi:hypothetical protein
VSPRPGWIGRACASLFFSLFLAAGCIITAMMSGHVRQCLEPWRWTRAQCEIVASSVRPPSDPRRQGQRWEFLVEYRYDAGGEWLTGTRWSTKAAEFARIEDAQRLAHRHRPGTRTVAWRDPADPRHVVLERQSPLCAGVLIFPLILAGVGASGLWAVWRQPRAGPSRHSVVWPRVLSACSCLVGAGVLWMLTLHPLLKILLARSWVATPCRVESSRVIAHTDSDGSAFRIAMLFSYHFGGEQRRSSRFDFSRPTASGYAIKAAAAPSYPVGAQTTCYVNPRAPDEAVLRRGPFKALRYGAIGLVFLALGALGLARPARPAPSAAP